MTQGQLAAAAGISRKHLVDIEHGRVNPSVGVASRIAEALGCTIEQLFGEPKRKAS